MLFRSIETLTYTALEGVTDPMDRATRVVWIPGGWWLPLHGLFRPEHAQRIGGFKRHRAGDYKCDWPWAAHMAVLGEHVRVPGVQCQKFIKLSSLSSSWRRNAWTNLAATAAVAREIRHAPLSLTQKARLHLTLAEVARAFTTMRYVERPEYREVRQYHRDASAAERSRTAGEAS